MRLKSSMKYRLLGLTALIGAIAISAYQGYVFRGYIFNTLFGLATCMLPIVHISVANHKRKVSWIGIVTQTIAYSLVMGTIWYYWYHSLELALQYTSCFAFGILLGYPIIHKIGSYYRKIVVPYTDMDTR
jgi:hypothetical protein